MSEEVRARIGEAAVAVIGTVGFEQTSAEMIADEAGVSMAEFEEHYPDKAECFATVHEELAQDFMALCAEAFSRGRDWRDQMRRTAFATHDYFHEDPARARFVALEPLNAGDRSAAFLDSQLNLLVEVVHAGRFELEDPDSVPRSAAEAAMGSIWKMLTNRIREDALPGEDSVPQLMYLAVMPYLGEEAAREELERKGRPE